ncbi:Phosphoribosylglycinamide formyltransferase, chloroplastic [Coccomyxa sp. Obi]|nr:Phosphoribosylglycinamide formyltransferase, chloroplastic [Coccomyxa sp. Obi]
MQSSPPALEATEKKPRLGIFVSGGGSNFRAIYAAIVDGRINADVAVVVSDVPGCGGWKFAAEHGIPTEAFPASSKSVADGNCIALTTEQLITALKDEYAVDYVLLAGYLKLIPEALVRQYKRAMLNIHPALLPNFGGKGLYGGRVHSAVIASGTRFSGPTIHFVDEGYDTGPILAQAVVPVYPTDLPKQLAARVLKEEHKLYPQAVAALVDGRITWRDDGIPVLWSAH